MSKSLSAAVAAALLVAVAGPAPAQQLAVSPTQYPALGRIADPAEIAAWDIAVRPDGKGLPPGKGSVKEGEEVFLKQCASCHGEFGEGGGRWPPLAGGHGSLRGDNPTKTPGSYWPYLSTLFDYVRRAMPFGNAQSLSADETYALTAFLLFMNDIVNDRFVLSKDNFASVKLPNQGGFMDDDRETAERHFWGREPCMKDCKADVKVLNRARLLDVTPEDKAKGPKVD